MSDSEAIALEILNLEWIVIMFAVEKSRLILEAYDLFN